MRLVDADALKEVFKDREGDDFTAFHFYEAIDNAPTVEYPEAITIKCDTEEDKQKLLSALRNARLEVHVEEKRPQGECNCSYCDYFKFSQSFIENIVKLMTDYNIETVEDLMKELNHINELLGGRE